MKNKNCFKVMLLLAGILFAKTLNGQYSEPEIIKFRSKAFGTERQLRISVPAEYYKYPNRKYKVIYLFDAQSTSFYNFNRETMSFLGANNSFYIDPVIIVGIITRNRHFEFLPKNKTDQPLKDYFEKVKLGGIDSLAISLKEEVLPFINKNYRTNGYNIAVGHSLGGSFVTYCMFKFPDLFRAGIIVSPNFFYDSEQFLEIFKNSLRPGLLNDKVLYVCYGKADKLEEKFKPGTIKFGMILAKTRFANFRYTIQGLGNSSHSTTPMEGIFKGLLYVMEPMTISPEKELSFLKEDNSGYLNYLKAYFKQKSEETGLLLPAVSDANRIAYNCFYNNKKSEAIKIMDWAISLYPDDANLYDGLGEFEEDAGNFDKAKIYYSEGLKIIEGQEGLLSEKLYESQIKWFKSRIEKIGKKYPGNN